MHDDEGTKTITDYQMPSLHLEEGIAGSTAKISQSVTLNDNLNFKIFHCWNGLLIFYFEGTF
jgi:hypothetical protein